MQADLKPSGWDFAKQSQSRTAPSAVLIAGFGVVFGLAFVSVAYGQRLSQKLVNAVVARVLALSSMLVP